MTGFDLPSRPYPGIRPFQKDEWSIFFGRRRMINAVVERLARQHIVVVHGGSGCGKSSLIRAGVLPHLEREHYSSAVSWRTVLMRPGSSPLWNLAEAIAQLVEGIADETAPTLETTRTVRRLLNRGNEALPAVFEHFGLGEQGNVCILIDQFEEIFRYTEDIGADEAETFISVLKVFDQEPPLGLHAIATMRSDFLGDCARFAGFAELVNKTQYLLPRLEDDDLLEAIRAPAELFDGEVKLELALRLIEESRRLPDALPLVQHCLMYLWQQASDAYERSPTQGAAEEPGVGAQSESVQPSGITLSLKGYIGLQETLSTRADQVLARLASEVTEAEETAEHLFRAITDIDGQGRAIRRPLQESSLIQLIGKKPDAFRAVIAHFAHPDTGFLVISGEADPIVDISHEALIRCWKRLNDPTPDKRGRPLGWLQRELEDGQLWRALLVLAKDNGVIAAPLIDDRQRWLDALPGPAWTERYGGGWRDINGLFNRSREARRESQRAEKEAHDAAERARLADQEARRTAEEAAQAAVRARQAAEEARRKERRLRALVTIAFVFCALFASFATYQWNEAQDQTEIAQEQTRVARESAEAEARAAAAAARAADLAKRREADAEQKTKVALQALTSLWKSAVDTAGDGGRIEGSKSLVSLLLALEYLPDSDSDVDIRKDYPVIPEAEEALRSAISSYIPPLYVLRNGTADIFGATFSSDGKKIAVGSDDGIVRIWDTASHNLEQEIQATDYGVRRVAFSPDGLRLAVASTDTFARIWNLESGALEHLLSGHSGEVIGIDWSPDGSVIVTGSLDNSAKVWDAETGSERQTLEGHGSAIWDVAISPESTEVLTVSEDGTAGVWNLKTGVRRLVLQGQGEALWAADWSRNGLYLVAASHHGIARVWGSDQGTEHQVFKQHDSGRATALFAVSISPDGRRLATGSEDGSVRVRDMNSGALLMEIIRTNRPVERVEWSPDGKQLLTASYDGILRSFAVAQIAKDQKFLEDLDKTQTLSLSGGEILNLSLGAKSISIVTQSADGMVRVRDAMGNVHHTIKLDELVLVQAALSPDGRWLATRSEHGKAHVWDAMTAKKLHAIGPDLSAVSAMAWSPDGSRLVTGSKDGSLYLWDVATGSQTIAFQGHSGAVTAVAFRRDGLQMASVSADKTLRIWDLKGGRALRDFDDYEAEISALDWSSDGALIVTGSTDGIVGVWSTENGELSRAFKAGKSVWDVAFSPNAPRIAVGFETPANERSVGTFNSDKTSHIMDARLGTGRITAFSWSADGEKIVIGWDNGNIGFVTAEPRAVIVERAKTAAERCLSEKERARLRVGEAPPDWCVKRIKPPYDAKGRMDRGFELLREGNHTEAQESFARALDINEDYKAKLDRAIKEESVDIIVELMRNMALDDAKGTLDLASNYDSTLSLRLKARLARNYLNESDNTKNAWENVILMALEAINELDGNAEWPYESDDNPYETLRKALGSSFHSLVLADQNSQVDGVVYSPKGDITATVSDDGFLRLFDARDGKLLDTLSGHDEDVVGVAFSPDGSKIVTGSFDNTARIWDSKTGVELMLLEGLHTDDVLRVAWSPNGSYVATSSKDNSVAIWDPATGLPVGVRHFLGSTVWDVAFSPDGGKLAAVSGDGSLVVWDMETGMELSRRKDSIDTELIAISWSHDGKSIAVGSQAGAVRLWDVETGTVMRTLPHDYAVYGVDFSPDDRLLATGSVDGQARVWDTVNGALVLTLTGHMGGVDAVSWSPDGRELLTGSDDWTARVWPIDEQVIDSEISLSERARRRVSRCLTEEERKEHLLDPQIPDWCPGLDVRDAQGSQGAGKG